MLTGQILLFGFGFGCIFTDWNLVLGRHYAYTSQQRYAEQWLGFRHSKSFLGPFGTHELETKEWKSCWPLSSARFSTFH